MLHCSAWLTIRAPPRIRQTTIITPAQIPRSWRLDRRSLERRHSRVELWHEEKSARTRPGLNLGDDFMVSGVLLIVDVDPACRRRSGLGMRRAPRTNAPRSHRGA